MSKHLSNHGSFDVLRDSKVYTLARDPTTGVVEVYSVHPVCPNCERSIILAIDSFEGTGGQLSLHSSLR